MAGCLAALTTPGIGTAWIGASFPWAPREGASLQSCMPLYLSGTGTKLCLQALPGPPTFKRYPPRLNQVPVFPFVPFIPFPAHACSVKKGFIEYILDVRPCVGETDVRKRNFHYQGNHSIVRETHVQR